MGKLMSKADEKIRRKNNMEEGIKRKLEKIQGDLEYIGWNLGDTKEEINNIWDELLIQQNNSIRDIENLKKN